MPKTGENSLLEENLKCFVEMFSIEMKIFEWWGGSVRKDFPNSSRHCYILTRRNVLYPEEHGQALHISPSACSIPTQRDSMVEWPSSLWNSAACDPTTAQKW